MPESKKVLIIDDETDLCLLLKDYFIRKNYKVDISHTIKEGLELLRTIGPDILFLDNNLPDGIGWTLAPEIAENYPSTYIVLISAFHPLLPEMPEKAQYRTIEKPISFADLNKQFSQL
ncbi:MAG: response regulator [Flavipsychrobacter sp.]|nr:response regulator [Flavipsychrobacter sp.]